MSVSKLLDMVSELLVEVLKHLDYQSIIRCSLVCQRLREVVNDFLELQYRIELGVDGVEPGNISQLRTTKEQLSSLFRLRAAWHTLCPSSGPFPSTISTGREPRSSFVHGVFGSTFWDGLPYASVFRFEAIRINPPIGLPTELVISTTDLPHQHTIFTLDPSQDLLVLVETRDAERSFVHVLLRQLSSGTTHPYASKADIHSQLPYTSVSARAEIADNVLSIAAFFSFHTGMVQIWDWNSGNLLVSSEVDTTFQDAITLISPQALLIASAEGRGSLDIYSFSSSAGSGYHSSWSSSPSSISLSSSGSRRLDRVARLQLPTLETGVHINEMRLCVGPYLSPSGRSGAHFISSPESRVVLLTIHYTPTDPTAVERQYTLVVHSRTLLRTLRDGQAAGAVRIVDWVHWGPHNTRLWHYTPPTDFISPSVYGQRVCYSLSSDDITESEIVEVLDFAPMRSWRPQILQPLMQEHDSHVYNEPTVVEGGGIFSSAVTTDLAYHVAHYPRPLPPSRGRLIDEHHLLFIQERSSLNPTDDEEERDISIYFF